MLVTILPDAEQEQCVVVIDENLQSEISAENSAGLLTVRVNASIRPSRRPELRLSLRQMPEKLAFSGSSAVEVGGKVTTATEWRLESADSVARRRPASGPGERLDRFHA